MQASVSLSAARDGAAAKTDRATKTGQSLSVGIRACKNAVPIRVDREEGPARRLLLLWRRRPDDGGHGSPVDEDLREVDRLRQTDSVCLENWRKRTRMRMFKVRPADQRKAAPVARRPVSRTPPVQQQSTTPVLLRQFSKRMESVCRRRSTPRPPPTGLHASPPPARRLLCGGGARMTAGIGALSTRTSEK